MRLRSLALLLVALAFGGCIGMLSIDPKPVVEKITPVPDRFKADQAPELVPSPVEGCQAAPSLDPNLYYCAKQEHWYRYALNRWYLAFSWDGNWFPASGAELPPGLAKLAVAPEKQAEPEKTREERLKELERKLEELEESEPEEKSP